MYVPTHPFYRVFVPTDAAAERFDPRSAIVAAEDRTSAAGFTVWLESNRFGMENMTRFVERVHHAAGRADQQYPTIAKCRVMPSDVIDVARYDLANGLLAPTNLPALIRWLDGEPVVRCFDRQALEWAEVCRAQGYSHIPEFMARQIPPLVLARARAYFAMFAERSLPATTSRPLPPC